VPAGSGHGGLGIQGMARLSKADADLRANAPQLLLTIRNLDAVIAKLDGVVDRLSRSWLFDLLGDPSRVPAPQGPPSGNAIDPASSPVSSSRPALDPGRLQGIR
jgi:hypothetical protein